MSTLTERVTLQEPATTYEGLRAQASLLNIVGRGAMRKAALLDAVTQGIALLKSEYEAAREGAIAPTVTPGETVTDVQPMDVITIEVHPTVAAVIRAVLADNGTRTTGHRGASVLMTREARKDYPATKRTRGKGKGRK